MLLPIPELLKKSTKYIKPRTLKKSRKSRKPRKSRKSTNYKRMKGG